MQWEESFAASADISDMHLATEDDGESLGAYMTKLNHTFKNKSISNGMFLMFYAVRT